MFSIDIISETRSDFAFGSVGIVTVRRMRVRSNTWAGDFIETTCRIVPATVRYHIVIENNSVSLPQLPGQGNVVHLHLIEKPIHPNNNVVRTATYAAILGEFVTGVGQMTTTNAHIYGLNNGQGR